MISSTRTLSTTLPRKTVKSETSFTLISSYYFKQFQQPLSNKGEIQAVFFLAHSV